MQTLCCIQLDVMHKAQTSVINQYRCLNGRMLDAYYMPYIKVKSYKLHTCMGHATVLLCMLLIYITTIMDRMFFNVFMDNHTIKHAADLN